MRRMLVRDELLPLFIFTWLTVMDGLIVYYRPLSAGARWCRIALFAATACSLLFMGSTIYVPMTSSAAYVAVDLPLGIHLRFTHWRGAFVLRAWPYFVAISLATAMLGPVVYLARRKSISKRV